MKLLALAAIAVFCAVAPLDLWAQQAKPPDPDAPQFSNDVIRVGVTEVVVPVLVRDREGAIVDGLQPPQFHLWDNGKEQPIHVDVTYEPLSVVIAIESSSRVDSILSQIRRLGTTVQPMLLGTQGEAAVLAFDSRMRVMQDFTKDPDKIKAGIDKITVGSSQSRMIDAVERSVYMLRNRPKENRKVILLISETRDTGSEARLRETMMTVALTNTIIFTVDITQLAVRLTEKQSQPARNPIDPTTMNNPMGVPNTPTSMEQNYSMLNRAQFIPVLKEIYTDAKGLFVKDPATQLARATGGGEFTFLRQKGLEDALQKINTEVRSQYMVTYVPNNKEEPGFHTIEVAVAGMNYQCKTRPGYWMGGGKAQ
jgi:VWFA-related protein